MGPRHRPLHDQSRPAAGAFGDGANSVHEWLLAPVGAGGLPRATPRAQRRLEHVKGDRLGGEPIIGVHESLVRPPLDVANVLDVHVDGGAVQARKSILEDAVQAALGQSAEVLALRERPELGPLGGIAATLRF